jgi:hypothetical protein
VAGTTASPAGPPGAGAARRARLFAAGLIAMLVVTRVPLPWRLSGLAFGVVALYAGIRLLVDLRALRRGGRRLPGRLGVSVGLVLAGLLMLSFLGEAALYPLVAEQDRCRDAALTHQDVDHCQQLLQERQDEIVRRLQGRPARAAG